MNYENVNILKKHQEVQETPQIQNDKQRKSI
jgi:hypothetical protein